jgi:NADH:ubiquinone oxidoreductase subunit K
MTDPGLTGYLILAAFLFSCGVLCLAVKRNAIGLLMGVELILNAANLNLLAAARYVPSLKLDAQMFALLVIVLAAAEAAVALAIFLNFYNNRSTVDVDDAKDLHG